MDDTTLDHYREAGIIAKKVITEGAQRIRVGLLTLKLWK